MSASQTLHAFLTERLAKALEALGLSPDLALVTATSDARFGDYQTNAAMVSAKQLKGNPRELAQQIVTALKADSKLSECSLEIAGAGFINFRFNNEFLSQHVTALLHDSRLGVPVSAQPQTIVIDFSSPNVAKPMHVGHIRSTILGDSLARIARFLGHHVITDNHLGDWGTQFGKVIYGWKHFLNKEALETAPVYELVRLYREVTALEEADLNVKAAVREELVKLQQGDPENLSIWKEAVDLSWKEFEKQYQLLGVFFDEHLGESFYREALKPLVERLLREKTAQESEGAIVIFFPEHPTLADKPFLIRKADGGFLYATTDIATLEYRETRWHPDAVWYVCGAPQQLHFEQLFAVARRLGLTSDFRHIAHGSILGEDGKMMKTRSGENVELKSLLEEAIERAFQIIDKKNPENLSSQSTAAAMNGVAPVLAPSSINYTLSRSAPTAPGSSSAAATLKPGSDFSEEEKKEIAITIGLGALKYADLMQHRMTDYTFSWDKMLSFQGNTAPYLQNAYVRVRSLFRKLREQGEESLKLGPITIQEAAERSLALQLIRFGEVLPTVLVDLRPNMLCLFLYELANSFHSFYEQCPILKAEQELRTSRLALTALTGEVLKKGLELLGIRVPERM